MARPKKIFRIPGRRLGRNHAEHGLYRHRHLHHQLAVLIVGFGVGHRVARDFAAGSGVIAAAKKIVAVGHRRKSAVEGNDFEIVFGQLELADDFGSEQTDDVGADGIFKTWVNFFRDRRAAEHMAPFEDENFFAGLG